MQANIHHSEMALNTLFMDLERFLTRIADFYKMIPAPYPINGDLNAAEPKKYAISRWVPAVDKFKLRCGSQHIKHKDLTELLTELGELIQAEDYGLHLSSRTVALHFVAFAGNQEQVMALLARDDTDASAQDELACNSLHWAAWNPEADLFIQNLIEAGADPNQSNIREDYPLHLAASEGNLAAIEILLQFTDKAKLNSKNNTVDNTPLHEAILSPKLSEKMLQVFIASGANLNIRGKNNWTVLYSLINLTDLLLDKDIFTRENPTAALHLHLAEMLLKNGANPDIECNFDYPDCALHFAIGCGFDLYVELLLHYDADPNIPDYAGRTALALAAETVVWKRHDPRCLRLLLQHSKTHLPFDNEEQQSFFFNALTHDYDNILLFLQRASHSNISAFFKSTYFAFFDEKGQTEIRAYLRAIIELKWVTRVIIGLESNTSNPFRALALETLELILSYIPDPELITPAESRNCIRKYQQFELSSTAIEGIDMGQDQSLLTNEPAGSSIDLAQERQRGEFITPWQATLGQDATKDLELAGK